MPQMNLPVATRLTIQSDERGTHTGLLFDTAKGVVGVAVTKRELSRLAALLIEQAGRVAATVTPDEPPNELAATPILASHLGFAQGRSETEALIAFQTGNLTVTFAVELTMLNEQCKRLLSSTWAQQPKRPAH